MALIEHIRAKRAALAEAIDAARVEYEQVEQVLSDLRRSLDMQIGALKVLDELLAEAEHEKAPASANGYEGFPDS